MQVTKEWHRSKVTRDIYYCERTFNGCTYRVTIYVENWIKSVKFHCGASSGRKRKDLEVFLEKDNKSTGGIRALLWIRDKIFEFPNVYAQWDKASKNKNRYILIGWSDNRRRNIYERLKKDGFYFAYDDGKKHLIKKL